MLDLYDHWGLSADPVSVEMIQRRYIERLVGCIENACNPASELAGADLKAAVSQMIESPRAQQAVELAVPRTWMMRAMLLPIRQKNVSMAIAEGRVISAVKRGNVKLFATLKGRR